MTKNRRHWLLLSLGWLGLSAQAAVAASAAPTCAPALSSLALHSQLSPQQQTPAQWQVWSGPQSLQIELSAADLQALWRELQTQLTGPVSLKSLRFEPRSGSYHLGLLARSWPFWDHFELVLSFAQTDQLQLSLAQNWFPSERLLQELAAKLTAALTSETHHLPLLLTRHPESLSLEASQQPLRAVGLALPAQWQMQGRFSPEGHLSWRFSGQPVANLKLDPAQHLQLNSTLCGPFPAWQGQLSSRMGFALGAKALQPIQLGEEKLFERLQAVQGQLQLQGQVRGQGLSWPQSQGSLQLGFPHLEVEGASYSQVQSQPFAWQWARPLDLRVWPHLPPASAWQPQFSDNALALFVGGPDYFREIKQQLALARHSIDQAIFVFYDGQTTRELARILILKALGLQFSATRQLQPDPLAPQGLPVRLQHNHKLTRQGAETVASLFREETDQILAQLQSSGLKLEPYQQRVQQQLRISALTQGVMHADHRKLLLIDGQQAYVGGLNLADHYLLEDGFHDLMVRVRGPAVKELQAHFDSSWQALNPQDSPPQPPAVLNTQPLPSDTPLSAVAVVSTSSAGWQIEAALLEVIAQAQHVIRLEHAYFEHEPIKRALYQALQRGVKLELLVSEYNDEKVFEIVNPANLLELMQAGQPGQVSCWLYQGQGGQYDKMVHSKFLSADGKWAIVGSANLVPRSLHSPFHQAGQPLLFNQELSLYLADPHFVAQVDQQLFEKDKQASKLASAQDLEQLIAQHGGSWRVLYERLKALLA